MLISHDAAHLFFLVLVKNEEVFQYITLIQVPIFTLFKQLPILRLNMQLKVKTTNKIAPNGHQIPDRQAKDCLLLITSIFDNNVQPVQNTCRYII